MYAPLLPRLGTFRAWRNAARGLASHGVHPCDVEWGLDGEARPLFCDPCPPDGARDLRVPAAFLGLARKLVPERSGKGMAVAYALLVRLQSQSDLLAARADADVALAARLAKDVRRDIHKMHAFLRFREVKGTSRRRFEAWFEPDHRIEEPIADFFVNRFGDMDWEIATPEVTLTYVDRRLAMAAKHSVRPDTEDALAELWATYYENIFNPARLKVDAMQAEMPKKYWRNLPETRRVPGLIASARRRTARMKEAAPNLPSDRTRGRS